MEIDKPQNIEGIAKLDEAEAGTSAAGKRLRVDPTVDGKAAPWVEKYRPKTLDDVAAHKDIIDTSERMRMAPHNPAAANAAHSTTHRVGWKWSCVMQGRQPRPRLRPARCRAAHDPRKPLPRAALGSSTADSGEPAAAPAAVRAARHRQNVHNPGGGAPDLRQGAAEHDAGAQRLGRARH